jgi:outer membrane protein TolC
MAMRWLTFGGLILVQVVLHGCVVRPQPLTEQAITSRVTNDLRMLTDGQETVKAPVTLDEAVARALRYNLDYRLKLMEEALYQKNIELLNFDMLPKLLASAGYLNRTNDSGGTSVSIPTGIETLSPSTSETRTHGISGAAFSWNILDFGISYYKARQQADQYLIAEERRRKVIQNVIQDVRTAYYRAYAAQKLMKRCDDLLEQVAIALRNSEKVELRGLAGPASVLQYQRSLIETTTLLIQKRRDLYLAKTELGTLMNMPPGADFEIAEVRLTDPMKTPTDIQKMEMVALMSRPELREEDYKGRISQADAKKLLLGALPGIELETALQFDSNKYLYNSNWITMGARASWNLFRLLSLPATMNLNEAQGKVDQVRRAALTMAVITQVRLANQRYDMALYDYTLAQKASEIDDKFLNLAQSGVRVGMENRLELIRSQTKALLSEFQKFGAYANVQAAYARLLNSIGLDLLPPTNELKDVTETAELMRKSAMAWDALMVSFMIDNREGAKE